MYELSNTVMCGCGILALSLFAGSVVAAGEAERNYVMDMEGKRPKPIVAIDNVTAWPNLTLLQDGTIIASFHNRPSHLKMPADIECWATKDGGRTWQKRGMPAPRDNERAARGHVAAGQAHNGDLVLITTGWSEPASNKGTLGRGSLLPPLVSRSTDGGDTWAIDAKIFQGTKGLIPFGDILAGKDGTLRAVLYSHDKGMTVIYGSRDNGKTWGEPVVMNKNAIIHEPALLHLGDGKWLAAARFNGLDLYASDDDAKTWVLRKKELTGHDQHPGHFTRLKDGRVLLSYGNRTNPNGVDVRFSDDEGKTWSEPFRVLDFHGDGGYPSSVQLPDGQVLTAYYASGIVGHNKYHMGVAVWDPDKTKKR